MRWRHRVYLGFAFLLLLLRTHRTLRHRWVPAVAVAVAGPVLCA